MDCYENFTIQAIPSNIRIRRENCLNYCNKANCFKMFKIQKDLNKCRDCKMKGLCYNKMILDGVCGICSGDEKEVDCNSINNYGCTNPENILDFNGVDPYYIIVKDENSFSYKEKCKFCWNI